MVRLTFYSAVLTALSMSIGAQSTNLFGLTSTNFSIPTGANSLTLREAVERVIIHNESLQAKMLDTEIARRQYRAEKGIFEPAVVGSVEHLDSRRENTIEQRASLVGRTNYFERNDTYNGGLEFLTPLGSKFRVGYDLKHLQNALNNDLAPNGEYSATVGITMTQPLLKNFGTGATLARIRLAAISSDIAYQDYRRQLMLTLAKAESAYWDLYFSQEQARISADSLQTANAIFEDNKARVEVGKSSELEVLQAQAGVSLRRARRNDAMQRFAEAANQLNTLLSGTGSATNISIWAAEGPEVHEVALNYYDGYGSAMENNPDYLTRKHQAIAENVRLAYARNQRLPQLDLKGSYGLNGLGESPDQAHEDLYDSRFPAWSVGVELRIPVTGGIRERNEYAAAKLSKQKAIVNLKDIEVQLGNALGTAILKVSNLRESVEDHRTVISFHQQLLENQVTRLQAGVIDSRTVLETEEKLFEARIALLENLVAYQKSLLELELVKGTTLLNRNIDMSKAELQEMTERFLATHSFAGPHFAALKKEIEQEYKARLKNLDANEKQETIIERVFH
jgi:outer membrane protein